MYKYNLFLFFICLLTVITLMSSCKKLIEVGPPIDTLTTQEMFSNNQQAEWAVAGIYSIMINGTIRTQVPTAAEANFAAGLSTIQGGFSADELLTGTQNMPGATASYQNKLTLQVGGSSGAIWSTAYKIIYDACAVLEGLESSTSEALTDSVKKQLTGEVLALRAFSYFYLVNFFGDLPLVLSTDINKTASYSRSPASKVYEQIKTDLVKASSLLTENYDHAKNEKVRISKWFAEALLARVYLYTGEYGKAINSSNTVIAQTGLFSIEENLPDVFKKNSREAILQLKQTTEVPALNTATPEGLILVNQGATIPKYVISEPLLNSFEVNDKRKTTWTSPVNAFQVASKYKNTPGQEYYMVMRLAELFLIRAEARLMLDPANVNDAITDINVLRRRAGVTELEEGLSAAAVLDAIMHERRVELFLEWGHRWFDLKRTGRAHDALSGIAYKQPWWGDYQFLYPIPPDEIKNNGQLVQNPQYNLL